MSVLNKPCEQCRKPMNGGVYRAAHVCPHCLHEHAGGKGRRRKMRAVAKQIPQEPYMQSDMPVEEVANTARKEPVFGNALPVMDVQSEEVGTASEDRTLIRKPAAAARPKPNVSSKKTVQRDGVMLTTKSGEDQNIINVIDDINVESVLSMRLTPDLFDNGKFIGTKSDKIKAALVQGKKNALLELKKRAKKVGANLVTFVEIKNTIRPTEANMVNIIVKASGTCNVAVTDEAALEF